MRKMNKQLEERLEEAEAIINKIKVGDMQLQEIAKYQAKYHPADELFEKWKKVWKGHAVFNIERDFNKAKELGLFTMALGEWWEKYGKNHIIDIGCIEAYEEIRTKYTTTEK